MENYKDLEEELKKNIQGEVRFDTASKAIYSTDASNYRQIPIGVVIPGKIEDVIETVKISRHYGVPILSRGGGTSLAGQSCNTAVIMDFSKYLNKIYEINKEEKYAIIEPGVVLDKLRDEAGKVGLTFGPDPATHNHCTLGGMMGNNSCGIHSVMAGKTVDNVYELEVLTYDGLRFTVSETPDEQYNKIIRRGGRISEIYKTLRNIRDKYADLIREKYPKIPRRVSGYNLDDLLPENNFNVAKALIGTESTCVTILKAKVKLVHNPPYRSLVVVGYHNIFQAGSHIPDVLESDPIGLEGMDELLIKYMERKGLNRESKDLLPAGASWLLVEFGGKSKDEADEKGRKLLEKLKGKNEITEIKQFNKTEDQHAIWEIRESGLGATAHLPATHSTWPGWEDSAVHPLNVGEYLKDLKKLFHKYSYDASLYGHFGQGCIHCRIPFELETSDGIKKYRSFIDEASDLVMYYGGSFSGEHGDGQSRGELLEKLFGKELMKAFHEFKHAWDPEWKMNPGKVIEPYKIVENLRINNYYAPQQVNTYFNYTEDDGNFNKAILRCVGVGKCRKVNEETMCPSYMVTNEEKHSTRGRARLLHEMMRGDIIKDSWKSEAVKEALDLCLACKACKGECPVNVDMATYKSEFYAHHYKGKIRPMSAYSMGLIYWWARIASRIPGLANSLFRNKFSGRILKKIGGIAEQREIPAFAKTTFRSWYRKYKGAEDDKRKKIILWPDTFNNFFFPRTAVAAYKFLDKLGYNVVIPEKMLCCGRPLYDFGFINLAKKLLRQTMDYLKEDIREGTYIVGLEPSCISTFRDELVNLFSDEEDVKRMSGQFQTLSEFLLMENIHIPRMHRKALVHGHCHHKSILGFGNDKKVLSKMDLEYRVLDSGCCGMAGSFGFEKEKYQISVDCGERVLIPEIREAEDDTIIVADGFSCREQIEQLSERQALHIAEILYAVSENLQFTNEKQVLEFLEDNMVDK